MIRYMSLTKCLIEKFQSCKLTQIPREHNYQADALANLGSALETKSQMSIPLLALQWPATEKEAEPEDISAIEERVTWMTPLIKYLESYVLSEDHNESRRIKKQPERYCLSQGKLYRRSFSGPYLWCLSPREATRILEELHDRECGSHSSGRRLVLRAHRAGYYWPTMAGDANRQAKNCSQCQRHTPASKFPQENLKSVSSPWKFRKWGMDIVGKFPMALGKKIFFLIVTD